MATILIVDDEIDTLCVLKLLLELEGHKVLLAGSMRTALAAADSEAPELVITDYMMPGGSGLELARALRNSKETRKVPIILHSAGREPAQHDARPYDCFLQKPVEFAELATTIRVLLRCN